MTMLKGKAEVRIFYEPLTIILTEEPIVNDKLFGDDAARYLLVLSTVEK